VVEVAGLTEKQERFAQLMSTGQYSQREAYKLAGYDVSKTTDKSWDELACRLKADIRVSSRIRELLDEFKERNMITKQRVLDEYAKLAFSDVTDFLDVRTERVVVGAHVDDNDDAEPISEITQIVLLKDTNRIDPAKLAAISEIRQTKEGIAFKLHDKKGALDSVAKHLGMFKESHEHAGPGGGPIQLAVSRVAGMTKEQIKQELEDLEREVDPADYELPEVED
jgi:phage terminase small subunit